MFLLFGGRRFRAARIALVAAFLIVFFAFHPHGTTLDVLQAVRVLLLLALVGAAWLGRRSRNASVDEAG